MSCHYIINGLRCSDHYFTLPLDHNQPQGRKISVYAREVASKAGHEQQLPFIVYFQGGPGFGAMRPTGLDGWIKAASAHYRVLLLDQRGTANSSPVTAQTLAHLNVGEQVEYLSHFRADSIVRDAELIRAQLIGTEKWSIIGQSFGGFCVLRYLSSAPEGLAQAFITGGIPSLSRHADDVYKATFPRVQAKNEGFFSLYPKAQAMAKKIADHLLIHQELMPNGQPLTVEQFQLLGIHLGMTGGHQELYFLMEQAFAQVEGEPELSYIFKSQLMTLLDYDTHPIFAFLHESIYCQEFASNWAAQRIRTQEFSHRFDYQGGEQPFYFTGEMIFPWMFEQFANLKPLAKAAQGLAIKRDWPALYDLAVLKRNQVPTAAAIYFDDMYVDINYSLETVAQVANMHTWVSSDYDHNGIRVDGELIFNKLHGLLNP